MTITDIRFEIPTENGLYQGISDKLYHADRTSLSSTGARKVLTCPARFKFDLDHPSPPTTALDVGTAAHTTLLGAGAEVVGIDATTRNVKAYKDGHQAIRDEGKVPLLASEVRMVEEMADVARRHPLVAQYLSEGEAELSGYYEDTETGVRLRFRPDWLTTEDGRPLLIDYKTTQSAEPEEFIRSIAKWGYHIQGAFYLGGLASLGIEDAVLRFIAQEKTPPYLVSVIELDADSLDEGARQARRAIDRYADCQRTDTWPGYSTDELRVTTVSLPRWAYSAVAEPATYDGPTVADLIEL